MVAPDAITLYQLEDHLEDAAREILESGGVNCLTQRSDEKRSLPVVGLLAQIGKQTRHKARLPDGSFCFDAWEARLSATIITDRTANGDRHDLIRAKVRCLLGDPSRWNAPLPYHAIADVLEAGTSPTLEQDEDLDVSEIAFELVVNIRPDAWPA